MRWPSRRRRCAAREADGRRPRHAAQEDWQRTIAVQDRLITLSPDAWGEWRDRGLAHAAQGHATRAVHDLETYLRHAEDALDLDVIAERVAALRRAENR